MTGWEKERQQNAARELARTREAMQRVALTLISEPNLAELVQVVTDAACELSGAAFGAFFYNQADANGESYTLYTLSGAPAEAFAGFPMPRNTKVFEPTFRGQGIVRIGDITQDPRYGQSEPYFGMPTGHLPVCSYLAVPVLAKSGEVLGGLFFGHPDPDVFSESDEQIVVSLAAQAAVAIDNFNLRAAQQKDYQALRKAEEISRRAAAIVESSDDAIISKNLDGIIQTWNAGAERLFGYKAHEAIGQPVTMLFPPEHIDEEPAIIARIRRGERVEHYETRRMHRDGSLIDISLTISPIRNEEGAIVGASKIARDISQRKRHEAALKEAAYQLAKSRDELEQRVEERTASLREAIAQMEEFSYTVSHDLRAPLRGMIVHCGVLMEDFRELFESEPDAMRSVQRIAENASRLDKMIRDVLAYGRVARDALHIEPISLDLIVQDTIYHYPALQAPQADIRVESLGKVLGHEPSVVQIVSNLLNNAVKFVAPGVHPAVRVWTESVHGKVRLWIEDNGIGIDPEYHHRLFAMFERIHRDMAYEGTGVGLAIVRKAAERMGGAVGVESELGKGSRFWVEFPEVRP